MVNIPRALCALALLVLSSPIGAQKVLQPEQVFFEFQVEQPATLPRNNPEPKFPAALRNTHPEGQVLCQFVVDTSGVADTTSFRILRTDHDLFSNAVREVLPRLQFTAAVFGGHKVRQLVQMPFAFKAPD